MENEQEEPQRYCYLCANSRKNKRQVVQSILTGWPVRLMCIDPYGAPGEIRDVSPGGRARTSGRSRSRRCGWSRRSRRSRGRR